MLHHRRTTAGELGSVETTVTHTHTLRRSQSGHLRILLQLRLVTHGKTFNLDLKKGCAMHQLLVDLNIFYFEHFVYFFKGEISKFSVTRVFFF